MKYRLSGGYTELFNFLRNAVRRSSLCGGRLLITRTNTKARNIPLSKHNHCIACEGVCYGLILPVLRYATAAGCIALQETFLPEIGIHQFLHCPFFRIRYGIHLYKVISTNTFTNGTKNKIHSNFINNRRWCKSIYLVFQNMC